MPVLFVSPPLWFFLWVWQSKGFSAPCHDQQTLQHKSRTFREGKQTVTSTEHKSLPQTPTTLRWDKKLHALSPQAVQHAYTPTNREDTIGQTHVPHDHSKPIMCRRFQVSRYSEVCDRMQPLLLNGWQTTKDAETRKSSCKTPKLNTPSLTFGLRV